MCLGGWSSDVGTSDRDRYWGEVVRRGGREAFGASHTWWHSKTARQQREWKTRCDRLLARWAELEAAGGSPGSPAAQEHAAAHVAWFTEIPGTPTHAGDRPRSAAMIRGLAGLYEANPDFHRAFGGAQAASFAADALRVHVRAVEEGTAE